MIVKLHLPKGPTAARDREVMCGEVRWWWERGMGYADMTAEQACHDTYMMNEHALCMLHAGSVMGLMHAGGGGGSGGPPDLLLRFQKVTPSGSPRRGHLGRPRITCARAGRWVKRLPKVGR